MPEARPFPKKAGSEDFVGKVGRRVPETQHARMEAEHRLSIARLAQHSDNPLQRRFPVLLALVQANTATCACDSLVLISWFNRPSAICSRSTTPTRQQCTVSAFKMPTNSITVCGGTICTQYACICIPQTRHLNTCGVRWDPHGDMLRICWDDHMLI